MRKIGILTFFGSDNPGTFFQAYCLLKALERRLPKDRVEIVNYRVQRAGFTVSLRPHRRDIYPPNFIEHVRHWRIIRRCYRECLKFGPTALVTCDYDRAAAFLAEQRYDLIVVGSDTILPFLRIHRARGQVPIFWLPPGLRCRKVACAASSDYTTYDSLDEQTRGKLAESIQAFDLIGIRDEMTRQLMNALGLEGDGRVEMVPDPTFTLPIDPVPAAALAERLGIDRSGPTFLAQLPAGPIPDALIAHLRGRGFREVSVAGKPSAHYHVYAILPFEWAGFYRHVDLTLTDRFHGSLFSLRNGTPVVAMDCEKHRYLPSGLSKTYCLMKEFGYERTHHMNTDRIADVQEAIRILDGAVASFDPERAQATAERKAREFNTFLDKVADLLR